RRPGANVMRSTRSVFVLLWRPGRHPGISRQPITKPAGRTDFRLTSSTGMAGEAWGLTTDRTVGHSKTTRQTLCSKSTLEGGFDGAANPADLFACRQSPTMLGGWLAAVQEPACRQWGCNGSDKRYGPSSPLA